MTELNTEINTKLNDIAGCIKSAQSKNDELEKKYDGLLNDQIKSLGEESAKLITEVNQLKASNEAESKASKESIEKLEAKLKRTGSSSDSNNDVVKAYKSAIREYARKSNTVIDEKTKNDYNRHLVEKFAGFEKEDVKNDLIKSLSVDSNPDGGYLIVPERLQTQKVDRIFETSPMRAISNIITTARESVELVIDDDEAESGGWVAEKQSRSNTNTPQIGLLEIKTHEQYAQPIVTQKMIDDSSIDIEAWLTSKTEDKLIRTENSAFVIGDGTAKPKGFLSYDAWASAGVYEKGKIEQVNSTTNGTFVADTIKDLQNSLKEDYQSNAVFMIKRSEWANIIKLKDQSNRYLFDTTTTSTLKEGDTKILLGKRVIFADDIQVSATGSLSMAYGDFNQGYTIVDRIGIRILRDPYTSKPFIKFYTTKRVGGAVTNYEAIKLYKLSA